MECPVVAGVSKDLSALRWLSIRLIKNLSSFKMDYTNFKAEDFNEESELNFSSNENEDDRSFINDNEEETQPPNFFRFFNQTRDPAEAVNDNNRSHLDTKDLQP